MSATGARSGGSLSWIGSPRWIRLTKRSFSGQPDRLTPGLGAQDLGRPPVAGQAAGVRGQQHDVCGAGCRVEVLLVLHRIAVEDARADDQRRRAVELRRRLGAGGLLEPLQRQRPHHPEAPGVGQVVVRRPAGQIEQLAQDLPRHGVRPEGLVGSPGADGDLDVHGRNGSRCRRDLARARFRGAGAGTRRTRPRARR